MNDPVVSSMVDRFATAQISTMPVAALEAAKLHIADTVGCAIAAYDADASQIARDVLRREPADRARVIGQHDSASVESATFANTVMIRYLDLNDSYNQIGSGHPSDLVGVALAAATQAGRSGADLITAVDAAYDCLCDLWDQAHIGRGGWDQGTMFGPAAAGAAGSLLGLSPDQIGETISMTAVSGVSVRQTRRGQLSMWKGMATAHAAKMAVSNALLAQRGASGPPQPFVGVNALGEMLFPTPPQPVSLRHALLSANMKRFGCCFHGQGPVELATRARAVTDLSQITSIEIDTYEKAAIDLAADAEKWQPSIRETADHSMPFLLAAALMDGAITEASFDDDRWFDRDTVALMQKVKVNADPELTAQFPDKVPSRLTVTWGPQEQTFTTTVDYPQGHFKRPVPPAEIREKFVAGTSGRLGPKRAEALYDMLMELDQVTDLHELVDATISESD